MSAPALSTLRLERDGELVSVVLERPGVHDAFDDVMIAEITEVFGQLASDAAARVVVLRSTGKHFCAGADLNWMRRVAEASEQDNRADASALEHMFRTIARCPKPVVARVQGAALGGGAGLVAAADIAIASTAASFGFTEARLGILPAVIAPYVVSKVGQGPAQALFLTGSRFGASRALQLGLVHQVVEPDQLDEATAQTVGELLQCSPEAQARIKALLPRVANLTLQEASAHTIAEIASARASEQAKLGMAAFLAKKKPPWVAE